MNVVKKETAKAFFKMGKGKTSFLMAWLQSFLHLFFLSLYSNDILTFCGSGAMFFFLKDFPSNESYLSIPIPNYSSF
jgi:hypothetical protein